MAIINSARAINGPTSVGIDNNGLRYASMKPTSVLIGGGTTIVYQDVQVEVERAITYHKRGFNPVSGQFEYWQTSDPEGLHPDYPAGNPFIDITIMVATDRS